MGARAVGWRRPRPDSRPHCYSRLRCQAANNGGKESSMKKSSADIIREYGPFDGVKNVAGVTFDGQQIWLAVGDNLTAVDPDSGRRKRSLNVAAHAGTAFDGWHLFQVSESRIQKIDP